MTRKLGASIIKDGKNKQCKAHIKESEIAKISILSLPKTITNTFLV